MSNNLWKLKRYQGFVIGILGSFILFNNLLRFRSEYALWADNFDSKFIFWTINWGYHILFESRSPLGFWNANSFYPHSTTLAYSDSLLSAQIFYAPLRLLGIPPLMSMYITFALVCITGCVLTGYALDRIGYFSSWENAFIIFSTHFSLSMIVFFVHYQLFGFQFAPSFFLFLYLYLRDFNLIDLLFACSILVIGVCFAIYLAPVLFTISIFLVVLFFLRWIFTSHLKINLKKIGFVGIFIMAGFSLLLYIVQIYPYISVSRQFPDQPLLDTARYSANIHSIIDGFSVNSLWYDPGGYVIGEWEYVYFPGYILLVIGFLSVLLLIYRGLKLTGQRLKTTPKNENSRPQDSITNVISSFGKETENYTFFLLFISLLFVICIVLSWGPFFKWNYEVNQEIRLPFYFLEKFIPGLGNIRAPGRIGMLIGLPLAVFVITVGRMLTPSSGRRNILIILLLAGVIIESLPSFNVYKFRPNPDGLYHQIAELDLSETTLIELPVFDDGGHLDTIHQVLDQLVGSTYHWKRLFVGYGSKFTDEYFHLMRIDQEIQNYDTGPRRAVNFGKVYGVTTFLIHLDKYDQSIAESWLTFVSKNKVCVLFEREDTILFSVDPSLCEQYKES